MGETGGKQFGGMQLLDAEYGHNKPIELNETAYYPIWYKGDILGASRVEAWEFIWVEAQGLTSSTACFRPRIPARPGSEIEPAPAAAELERISLLVSI